MQLYETKRHEMCSCLKQIIYLRIEWLVIDTDSGYIFSYILNVKVPVGGSFTYCVVLLYSL